MQNKKQRFNILLDADLLDAARKRGVRLRKSVSEMVRELFVEWLVEESNESKNRQ